MVFSKFLTALAIFSIVTLVSGCGRSEKEYRKLVEENGRLKAQLEKLQGPVNKEPATPSAGADLILSIPELWLQRFEDVNDFRARQRLAGKIMRLSGDIESVSDDSVVITGYDKRFGTMRMNIKLVPGYAIRIRNGLALIEKGASVAVQGKFIYERMAIDEAVFVNPETGKTLYSENLTALSSNSGTPSIPVPPANGGAQK